VDTGRELMVPWRLARGERLYADVEFLHGPLGPWAGAAIDHFFGRSLPARTALAAGIALLHLAALVLLCRRMLAPRRAALAASLAVAAVMFVRPGGWLFPFSFDAAIAVAAIAWALELTLRDARSSDVAAGACLAAALLARVEIGLAAVAALAFATRRRDRLRFLALWPLAAAAAGYGFVSLGVPFETLRTNGWLRLLDPPEAFRNVYRAYAGLDRVGLRAAELLLSGAVLVLAAALLCIGAYASSRPRSRAARTAAERLAIVPFVLAAVVWWRPPSGFAETAALFPPLVRVVPIGVIAAGLWRIGQRLSGRPPRGPLTEVPDAVLWIASLFAVRLLLAAGYVGPYNAFFLPLPIVVAVAGVFSIADLGAQRLGPALSRLTTAALAVFLLYRAAAMGDLYRGPAWARVETAAGSVRLREPVASATRLALVDLQARLPESSTLAGFPEAGFFNYALGRRNPYVYEQYFPGHLDAGAEKRLAASFTAAPPDAVLYANVLAVGEGALAFGKDYLRSLDAAVRSRTRTAMVCGAGAPKEPRVGDADFFVEIRVPNEAAAAGNGP
jgi:hypothetical protein